MKTDWPPVSLGELLKRSEDTILPSPDSEYREITVKLWGKGVTLRSLIAGAQCTTQRRFLARSGQFIVSRIDARNGAFGIVPPALDGAIVSNDFPLFNIASDRLLPEYLGWLSKTKPFVEECRRASEGSTNRVRLQEKRFLAATIPLPPIREQRRVVTFIGKVASDLDEIRTLKQQSRSEAEALIVSMHRQLAGKRVRTLGQILNLFEQPEPVLPTDSYPQVGVRAFGHGLFPKGAVEGTATSYKAFNRLYAGALVLSQVKGWEGAVAVCPPELDGWFVSPEYRTFQCIEGEIRPGYLATLVRTEWFWSMLAGATRGVGARRERTRPEQFLEIELPMPDIEQQEKAVQVFAEISLFEQFHDESMTDLEALLPSILDTIF